jgi:hypothetical protein
VIGRARLDELAAMPIEAPTVIVIGAVAALRLRDPGDAVAARRDDHLESRHHAR